MSHIIWLTWLILCTCASGPATAADAHSRPSGKAQLAQRQCVLRSGKPAPGEQGHARRGRRCDGSHRKTESSPAGELLPASAAAPVAAPRPSPAVPDPEYTDPGAEPLARGEEFGGEPADVLLAAAAGVSLGDVDECVGILGSGATVPFGGAGREPGSIRLELVPEGSMPTQVRCPTEDGERLFEVAAATPSPGGVVTDPIDSKYLTEVPFGSRSFWIQPWRSYLDTWPASRLLDAVGINFNVSTAEADSTARLLQSAGFRLARTEISWNQLSYEDPSEFVDELGLRERLVALREHGLRPLILLNANSGDPAPSKPVTLTTLADAPTGARTVKLDGVSAASVVPGRTGFAGLSFGGDPDVLITSVDKDGTASLSQPLSADLAAGPHPGNTLRYAPFGPPKLSSGAPNPEFERTLDGWLEYVAAVTREADKVFGEGNYDLEIWNELSFGSQFLNEGNYYSPARVSGSGSVTAALLNATVDYLRDPDHGVSPEVGISDGFASQTPFASADSVPAGTTALSKHLYAGPQYFPRTATINGVRPVDALGNPDSTTSDAPYQPKFTPNYGSALPEYFLTATQTETLVRDLSPNTTRIYGVPHGREVGPAGGDPTQVWMTEYNLNTNTLLPLPTGNQDEYVGPLDPAQEERLQAEIVLRSLVSMVGKGLTREYFYAAAHSEGYDLISEAFMDALDANPGAYPGDQLGGDTMTALPRMLSRFDGPGPSGSPRQLQLLSIAQAGNHAVWAGDGSAAHPDLRDREILAVLPFQSAPQRFVIPVYVMTPNLTTIWNPNAPASSPTRFDLPDQRFRITLANLPQTADPPQVSAYDPLRDESTPARFVSRSGDRAVFEIAATNYPRLLSIDYGS